MTDQSRDLTLDQLRARIRAAGLEIREDRLPVVHRLLRDALRPIRAMDPVALRTLEPAVTFDAAAESHRHGQ